jgi:hypothetical protein
MVVEKSFVWKCRKKGFLPPIPAKKGVNKSCYRRTRQGLSWFFSKNPLISAASS